MLNLIPSSQLHTQTISHATMQKNFHKDLQSSNSWHQMFSCPDRCQYISTKLRNSNQPKICDKLNYSNYNKLASCCNHQGFWTPSSSKLVRSLIWIKLEIMNFWGENQIKSPIQRNLRTWRIIKLIIQT